MLARMFGGLCCLAAISFVVWSVNAAIEGSKYEVVKAKTSLGEEVYMVQQCFGNGCNLLGYRYPLTEEGLRRARAKRDSFRAPEPVVIEEVR
jgi:hypothetical protein